MSHLFRFAGPIRTALTLATLLACVLPAGAAVTLNGLNLNGLVHNGLANNALATNALSDNALSSNALSAKGLMVPTGTALGELNGVVVESITLPEDAVR